MSMDLDRVRKHAFTVIKNAMAANHATVVVGYENQKFSQPKDAPWVYVTVLPSVTHKRELGGQSLCSYGVINVHVNVPAERGTDDGLRIIQTLIDTLVDKNFALTPSGYLTYYGSQARTRGNVNGWYARNFLCEFKYTDTRN